MERRFGQEINVAVTAHIFGCQLGFLITLVQRWSYSSALLLSSLHHVRNGRCCEESIKIFSSLLVCISLSSNTPFFMKVLISDFHAAPSLLHPVTLQPWAYQLDLRSRLFSPVLDDRALLVRRSLYIFTSGHVSTGVSLNDRVNGKNSLVYTKALVNILPFGALPLQDESAYPSTLGRGQCRSRCIAVP